MSDSALVEAERWSQPGADGGAGGSRAVPPAVGTPGPPSGLGDSTGVRTPAKLSPNPHPPHLRLTQVTEGEVQVLDENMDGAFGDPDDFLVPWTWS